jgi:hypothetical protein
MGYRDQIDLPVPKAADLDVADLVRSPSRVLARVTRQIYAAIETTAGGCDHGIRAAGIRAGQRSQERYREIPRATISPVSTARIVVGLSAPNSAFASSG